MTTELKPKYGHAVYMTPESVVRLKDMNSGKSFGRYFSSARIEIHDIELRIFTPDQFRKEAEELLREGWEAAREGEDESTGMGSRWVDKYPDFDSFLNAYALKSRK